jgi:hypothetical protein
MAERLAGLKEGSANPAAVSCFCTAPDIWKQQQASEEDRLYSQIRSLPAPQRLSGWKCPQQQDSFATVT